MIYFFQVKNFGYHNEKKRISHETSVLTEVLPLKEGTDNNDYDINEDQSDRVYCTRKHGENQNSYCSQHNGKLKRSLLRSYKFLFSEEISIL